MKPVKFLPQIWLKFRLEIENSNEEKPLLEAISGDFIEQNFAQKVIN